MITILLQLTLMLFTGDFPICQFNSDHYSPSTIFADSQYYVLWSDNRYTQNKALFCTPVTTEGTVIHPDGVLLFGDSVDSRAGIDFDGSNFLATIRFGC